jgi:hypothetical protein
VIAPAFVTVAGSGYSLIVPVIVMRTMAAPSRSVNHIARVSDWR